MTDTDPLVAGARPHFSVVVPVLNRVDVIERCLDSLITQELASLEIVVIDGGSSDGTVEAIKKRSRFLAYWESKPDQGIYDAWNKGLQHTHGRWIGFMGADDRFASTQAIKRLGDAVAKLPTEVTIIYPRAVYVDERDTIYWEKGDAWNIEQPRLLQGTMAVPPGVFYRRDVFERNGSFDTAFRICGDFDMVLRETMSHEASLVDSVSMLVGAGGISWKFRNKVRILKETRASLLKNNQKVPWGWRAAYFGWWIDPVKQQLGRLLRHIGILPARRRITPEG